MTQLHFLLLALFLRVGFGFGNQGCEADHECNIDSYCYEFSHLCVPCTDCSAYKRLNSVKNICSKNAYECGDCLPGFKEEYLTKGKRDFCIVSQINSDSSDTINSFTLVLLLIFTLFLLLLIFVIIFFWYRYIKNKARGRTNIHLAENGSGDIHEIQRLSQPPPPYPEIELESREIVFNVSSSEELKLNQASVFREPDSPYNNSQPTAPPELQDEDTAPSDWTPGGEYSGSADFSGLFPIAAASSAPERLNESSNEDNSPNSSLEVASVNISPEDNDSGLTTPSISNSSLVGQATAITVAVPTTSHQRNRRQRRRSLENTASILAKRPRRCEEEFDSGTISQECTSGDENTQSNSEEDHHRHRSKSRTLP